MSSKDAEPHDSALAKRAKFIGQMRRVPGPVAIIASQMGTVRTGLAATAWTALSADPPMLLVCVNRSASAHKVIGDAQAFSINLLASDEFETVAIFSAQRGLEGDARFIEGQWATGPRNQPILNNAVVTFECTRIESHDFGTHTIFIGEVDEMGGTGQTNPLLYFNGSFAALESVAAYS